MLTAHELRHAYEKGEICGWAEVRHPGLAREQFSLLTRAGDLDPKFTLLGQTRITAGRKLMLWEVVRKVLGKDTENYPQQIGDCVSFGAKNATEYLQCCEILMSGDRERWRPVFPSYYYGTGRVYVGGGRLGYDDGSLGSWMAEAVMKFGTLFSDENGVPTYSGRIAKAWGDPNPRNDLDTFRPVAEKYPVRSAALIRTWNDLVAAICNGYPCTTASNVGYSMEASSDGFHRQTASWPHQMVIVGVDDGYKNGEEPYAVILNSWGDAHGRLKDFETGEPYPMGVLRVRRRDIEKHLRAGETFAFSQFQGFPEQDLDKKLFDLIGDD